MTARQVIAEWLCPCGARGTLFEGATADDYATFYEDCEWHDSCEPRELTPADVLPDAAALAARVPTDIDAKVAIEAAEWIIARPVSPYFGMRERIADAEGMVTWSVLRGDSIERVRGWAMVVALLRDAEPTAAERHAAHEAIAA